MDAPRLYMIDFGVASRYCNEHGLHYPSTERDNVSTDQKSRRQSPLLFYPCTQARAQEQALRCRSLRVHTAVHAQRVLALAEHQVFEPKRTRQKDRGVQNAHADQNFVSRLPG